MQYWHFKEFDSTITDDQNHTLQAKLFGKLGHQSLGELLLINTDTNGKIIPAPQERLQWYIAEPEYAEWDIFVPAISPEISWDEALTQISQYSLAHPHLTLAFEQYRTRYRVDHLGPIEGNAKGIELGDTQKEDLEKLRFFRGKGYIVE